MLGRSQMLWPNEREHGPVGTCSTGTTRAVDVVGGVGGWVEVDYERHRIDMDTPRCDVGGDEHVEPPSTKRGQCTLTLTLTAIPVDGG